MWLQFSESNGDRSSWVLFIVKTSQRISKRCMVIHAYAIAQPHGSQPLTPAIKGMIAFCRPNSAVVEIEQLPNSGNFPNPASCFSVPLL
jgi:hypothetical protein